MAGHGWPLAYLWDYGQQKIRNCQVNLASEWGWGRNVRVTSWVAFCVLGMSNSCRRTRKGYKQTGLCVFSSEGMALENEGGIWLLLCTLLSWFFFFFAKGIHVFCHMNATWMPRAFKVWKISVLTEVFFAGSEADFCCCCYLFSVSFFLLTLKIYMTLNALKGNRKI